MLGRLKDSHRGHPIHSVNVLLLGLCLAEEFPDLKASLLAYPHESWTAKPHHHALAAREMVFHFRWYLASLYHDVGYPLELIAQHLVPESIRDSDVELAQALAVANDGIQRTVRAYMERKRSLPHVAFLDGYDDEGPSYCAEHKRRPIPRNKDLVGLFAGHIARSCNVMASASRVRAEMAKTFDRTCRAGDPLSFDHGKIGALLLMHELRSAYEGQRATYDAETANVSALSHLSWHRANIYYEGIDAATAIYLHNTLRFELDASWGPFSPLNVPPLSYLLFLCDLLVEWDKQDLGRRTTGPQTSGEHVLLSCTGSSLRVVYQGYSDVADSVSAKLRDLLDDDFLEVRVSA